MKQHRAAQSEERKAALKRQSAVLHQTSQQDQLVGDSRTTLLINNARQQERRCHRTQAMDVTQAIARLYSIDEFHHQQHVIPHR